MGQTMVCQKSDCECLSDFGSLNIAVWDRAFYDNHDSFMKKLPPRI